MKKIMMNKGISTPTHSHTKLYTHTHKSHMHRLSAAQSPMYSRVAPIAFHRFVVSLCRCSPPVSLSLSTSSLFRMQRSGAVLPGGRRV